MEKLSKELTLKYALLQSVFWMGQCCMFGFAAVYLKSRGFENTQVGVALCLACVLSTIIQPFIAGFADRTTKVHLRTITMVLMLIVLALGVILLIIPDSYLFITIFYMIMIAIQITLVSLLNSLAVEYINLGILMNYGLARGISSIAFALTSFGLGIVLKYYSGNILLPIFLVFYVLFIGALILFKIDTSSIPLPEKEVVETEQSQSDGILAFLKKYKKFTILLIGMTMVMYSHNLINTYLINIVENVGGDNTDMGISLSIAAGLELPTMAVFILIVKKVKCSTLLKISAFFFFIKSGLVWLAPNMLTLNLSQLLQLFGYALFTPASVYYVNEIIDSKNSVKGQSMVNVATFSLVGAIGSITGGRILDTKGVSTMLLVATIVTGIGFIIVCCSTEDTKKQTK
jgi:PPP family 3-phenylpropionic acid transporter